MAPKPPKAKGRKPAKATARPPELPALDVVELYGAAHTDLRDRIDELQIAAWAALNAADQRTAARQTLLARGALKQAHQALDRFGRVLDRRKRRRSKAA